MIHLFDKTRPGQTRGVPYLAPVTETIKQMDRYRDAEVMATVVAAMLTVLIKTEESEDVAPVLPMLNGNQSTAVQASDNEVGPGSGAVVELNPGEEITTVNPARPQWLRRFHAIGASRGWNRNRSAL